MLSARSLISPYQSVFQLIALLAIWPYLISCSDGIPEVNFLKPLNNDSLFPHVSLKISGVTELSSNNPSPTIEVSGLNLATRVELFSSSNCNISDKIGEVLLEESVASVHITPPTLIKEGTYQYYAKLSISENLPTSCSKSSATYHFDTTPPTAPTAVHLKTSSHNIATPSFEIQGLEDGSTVTLFADETCSILQTGPVKTVGSTLLITSDALSEGTHNIYAQATDQAGNRSPCSPNFATYIYDVTPPSPPTQISLAAEILPRDNNTTPTFQVSGLSVNDTLKLYSDSTCLVEINSVPITADPMSVTLIPALTIEGDYFIYAKAVDPYGNASSCSVATATYTLDLTPPNAPTLALLSPASSPGNSASPQIQAYNLEMGDWIGLFSDSTCTSLVASSIASNSTLVLSPPTLSEAGTYNYYAYAKDAAGNKSSCSTGLTYAYDNQSPSLLSVTALNTNKTYGPTATISIQLVFNESVTVSAGAGTPTLALNTTPGRLATYESGSGTNELIFKYTIERGDESSDLDYLNTEALSLNGGSILDLAANPLSGGLPTPGTMGSLGANKDIVVTGYPPLVSLSGPLTLSLIENAGPQTLELSLNYETVYDIHVHLSTYGNGLAGVDYNLSLNQITIPAGASKATFTYTPADNDLVEGYPRRNLLSLDSAIGSGGALLNRIVYKEIHLIDNDSPLNASSIAVPGAAAYHSCAIKGNGEMKCWGNNQSGQLGDSTNINRFIPTLVNGLNNVQNATLGGYHTCAIKTDNSLWCWGENNYGQLGLGETQTSSKNTPAQVGSSSYLKVSAGLYHTCAITTDNALWCWGGNSEGQLGNNSVGGSQLSPIEVLPETRYADVFAGAYHTCAITTSGSLHCWGYNYDGQVGNGHSNATGEGSPVATPTAIDSGVTYARGSAGHNHTCALTTTGALKCWGNNAYYQLGVNSPLEITTPTVITASGVSSVVAGPYHTCAFGDTTTDNLVCWGANWNGQLGLGTNLGTEEVLPTAIKAGNVLSLATGYTHTCAGLSDGTMKCWGSNEFGQLGIDRNDRVTTLAIVESNFQSIATSDQHGCGITREGALRCWGDNTYGQLGDGTTFSRKTPAQVIASGVLQVAVSPKNSCAVLNDGKLVCWGYNQNGQVGDGTTVNRHHPVTVLSSGTRRVSLGLSHACALMENSSVKCWGTNGSYGLVGNNTTGTQSTPIQIIESGATQVVTGPYHSCALVSGTAHCWGSNTYGQFGDGTTLQSKTPKNTGIAMDLLAIGQFHTCGIKDEKLFCWGYNLNYNLGDSSSTSRLVPAAIDVNTNYLQVTSHYYHSCAVSSTGLLKCWGNNSNIGINNTTPATLINKGDIQQVSLGLNSVCALFNSGDLKCLGKNSEDQLGIGYLHRYLLPLHVFGL